MQKRIHLLIEEGSETNRENDFLVEEKIDHLCFQVSYPAEFQNASFIEIYDEKGKIRLRKMLGYGEQMIGIGEMSKETSVGGVPGKLGTGRWKLEITMFDEYLKKYKGTFPIEIHIEISSEKKDITEPMGEVVWVNESGNMEIDSQRYLWNHYYQKGKRWYAGDFHTHTRLSDGKETVKNATQKALDKKMDFYIPTEHNLVHTGWEETSLMIVPGVEVTTEIGHFNLFGIHREPSQLQAILGKKKEEVVEASILHQIQEARQNHWLVSINHPFLHVWKWECGKVHMKDIDCLEIINDPTYEYSKAANDKAIHFLDFLWTKGFCITGIGGSDSHNLIHEYYPGAEEPSIPGDPMTYVYLDGLTPEKLLEGVKAGHVCVTRHCRLDIKIFGDKTSYLPGDAVKERQLTISGACTTQKKNIKVYRISYGMEEDIQIKELTVKLSRDEKRYLFEDATHFLASGWQWIRYEIREENGDFMAYTTPIYHGTAPKDDVTFDEIRNAMEWRLG